MAAPTAPPPSAMPPPIMAPASFTASAIVGSAIGASPLGCDQYSDRCVGRTLWCGPGRLVVVTHGGVEIEDGQQGEDECLNDPDGQVEDLPDRVEHDEEHATDRYDPEFPLDEKRQEGQHQPSGQQVAEESKGQGDRLGQLLDQVDEDVERKEDCLLYTSPS